MALSQSTKDPGTHNAYMYKLKLALVGHTLSRDDILLHKHEKGTTRPEEVKNIDKSNIPFSRIILIFIEIYTDDLK